MPGSSALALVPRQNKAGGDGPLRYLGIPLPDFAAYSRAAAWVWAAIVAMDRGEVAELRRHVRALASMEDEGPAQVRLATEMFAGHLAVLDGRTEWDSRGCGRYVRNSSAVRRPRRGAELWEAEIRRLRAVFLAALGA